MEEDLLEGLQDVDADCGEQLQGQPFVEHYVAGFLDFREGRSIGPEEGEAEEGEEEFLEREDVAGGAAGGGELRLQGIAHGVERRRNGRNPGARASSQDVYGELFNLRCV